MNKMELIKLLEDIEWADFDRIIFPTTSKTASKTITNIIAQKNKKARIINPTCVLFSCISFLPDIGSIEEIFESFSLISKLYCFVPEGQVLYY